MPWCRTSHGASPRLAPIISAMPMPQSTSPRTSRGRRWSVVRAGAVVNTLIPRRVSTTSPGSGSHARRDLLRLASRPRPHVAGYVDPHEVRAGVVRVEVDGAARWGDELHPGPVGRVDAHDVRAVERGDGP